ncbi:hypothetical protein F5Y17DRAFT_51195 [Xylariaceae sp. FL0594]|nr:hypothetical protein F5Y17DRAFT_51195 [Xylariaceae sp. FL0594]
MMLAQLATTSGLLLAACLAPLAEAKGTTIRPYPRADYAWTIKWTAGACPSWPCTFSYEVSAPSYTSPQGNIPLFDATCEGTVDQPLSECTLLSPQQQADANALVVSGNFSTYETSGVGAGLVDVTATFYDQMSGTYKTLTAVTPKSPTNTWQVTPSGCPVTYCTVPQNATRSARRKI